MSVFFTLMRMSSCSSYLWRTSCYLLSIKLAHYQDASSPQQTFEAAATTMLTCTGPLVHKQLQSTSCYGKGQSTGNSMANGPRPCLDLQPLKKWGLAGTVRAANQLNTQQDSSGLPLSVLSHEGTSSNQNYYVKQVIKNQMNNDSVGSIVIWTPQN